MTLPLLGQAEVEAVLRQARRIAVLGIKPDSRAGQPAHDIPARLLAAGYDVVPVPVRYPEAEEILARPVVRDLRQVPPPVDVLNVFRRPADVPGHLQDMLALRPAMVWFQPGCLHEESAEALYEAGIQVAHTCIDIVLRRL